MVLYHNGNGHYLYLVNLRQSVEPESGEGDYAIGGIVFRGPEGRVAELLPPVWSTRDYNAGVLNGGPFTCLTFSISGTAPDFSTIARVSVDALPTGTRRRVMGIMHPGNSIVGYLDEIVVAMHNGQLAL